MRPPQWRWFPIDLGIDRWCRGFSTPLLTGHLVLNTTIFRLGLYAWCGLQRVDGRRRVRFSLDAGLGPIELHVYEPTHYQPIYTEPNGVQHT